MRPGNVATSRLHAYHSWIFHLPPWDERETPAPRTHERGGHDHFEPGSYPGMGESREVEADQLLIAVQFSWPDDWINPELSKFFQPAV